MTKEMGYGKGMTAPTDEREGRYLPGIYVPTLYTHHVTLMPPPPPLNPVK
jgi:hypothetical protein